MSARKACLPFVVIALGSLGIVFPGIVPDEPDSQVSSLEFPAKQLSSVVDQEEQQEAADATPQSQSKRLTDYHSAMWDPIHRQPAILEASNQDCLKCHNDILSRKVAPKSPAGLKANETLAWYQTLDTYEGDQETFHWRHLESPYAKKVMNLKCNFCHLGNDPREEAPFANGEPSGFTLRKTVDPEKTCLKCHAQMNWKVMTLPTPMLGPWHQVRDTYQNDCLSCHAIYRTVRHQVSYLNAENIEELAKPENIGGDVCYGCHGGRAWYNKGYPYPRHEYPGIENIPDPYPEWSKDRPKESDPRFALPIKMPETLVPAAGADQGTGQTGDVETQSGTATQPPTTAETSPPATGEQPTEPPATGDAGQKETPTKSTDSKSGSESATAEPQSNEAAKNKTEEKDAGK